LKLCINAKHSYLLLRRLSSLMESNKSGTRRLLGKQVRWMDDSGLFQDEILLFNWLHTVVWHVLHLGVATGDANLCVVFAQRIEQQRQKEATGWRSRCGGWTIQVCFLKKMRLLLFNWLHTVVWHVLHLGVATGDANLCEVFAN
jgi:hypothetical protein